MRKRLKGNGYRFPASCIGILADLWARDGVTQKQLGHSLIKTKSSINKMLKALESEGLVIKQQDPKDKRNKLIFLTEKGTSLQRTIEQLSHEIEAEFLEKLKPEEMGSSKNALSAIYSLLLEKNNIQPLPNG